MIRQKDNKACYRVAAKNHYIVVLDRLGTNYNGILRFEATIINLDKMYDNYCGGHTYRFTSHHLCELDEAIFIVNYHEKKIEKMYNN